MPICAISTCKNSSYHTRKLERNRNGIIFHRFPLNELERAKAWFHACMRSDRKNGIPTSQDAICSDHFLPSDYERDLKHELLNLPPRKKGMLKSTAMPSLKLPGNFKPLSGIANTTSRIMKKSCRPQSKANRQSNLRKKLSVQDRSRQSSVEGDFGEDSMAASPLPRDENLGETSRTLLDPPEEKWLKNGTPCQLLQSMCPPAHLGSFLGWPQMDSSLLTSEGTPLSMPLLHPWSLLTWLRMSSYLLAGKEDPMATVVATQNHSCSAEANHCHESKIRNMLLDENRMDVTLRTHERL